MPQYELIWRNKFLTADCQTLGDMADRLAQSAEVLRTMDRTGKVRLEGGAEDDYARLVTDDEAVAIYYDFEEIEDDGHDEDEDGDEADDDETWRAAR